MKSTLTTEQNIVYRIEKIPYVCVYIYILIQVTQI
jgi:hypothetical protein